MNVLVIGKGGREHALVWKLAQSPRVKRVFCVPGNAGTGEDATNVALEPMEFDKLIRFAQKEAIGLTIVGPEDPLAAGIVDAFQKEGLKIVGPSREAARLEASKVFAKQLMRHADVPTGEFKIFDHPDPARTYIETREYPVVVKADGLAAGKGVVVCNDNDEALAAIERIMVREEFGLAAGRQVVVEKRLEGQELSVLALVSGRAILMLQPCQDHKHALDGDQGPNTGGMGAYCPTALATPELMAEIESQVFVPIVHALKRNRTPFKGVLYAGLMITPQGPRVLEFNVRFGDPELQAMLMRLQTDLVDLLEAVADETLDSLPEDKLVWDPRPAITVVMTSKGYPGNYAKGYPIAGLAEVKEMPDVKVFHAGTRVHEGRVVTDGGRVLNVTALGNTLAEAKIRAYKAVRKINFTGATYRKDIGDKGTRTGILDSK